MGVHEVRRDHTVPGDGPEGGEWEVLQREKTHSLPSVVSAHTCLNAHAIINNCSDVGEQKLIVKCASNITYPATQIKISLKI